MPMLSEHSILITLSVRKDSILYHYTPTADHHPGTRITIHQAR